MPSQALTPESLMARADSKNPATTCKGLTTSGRPCRRSLGTSARNSPASSPGRGRGVIAVSTDTAAFYCWQHKDQANGIAEMQGEEVQVVDLQKRSSVDSLAARLGLLNVDDAKKKRKPHHHKSMDEMPGTKPTQPATRPNRPSPTHRKREKGNIHVSLFCCMRGSEVDDSEPAVPVRPVQRKDSSRKPNEKTSRPLTTPDPLRPSTPPLSPLAYLPRAGQPATLALLSGELAKPLTHSDYEPGYIYIFWVVPAASGTPRSSDATALLAPPRSARPPNDRQVSELLRQYSVKAPPRAAGGGERRTIMLKIGRTINVQRRMYDWKRQCREDIMLLRSYPYLSKSPSASSSPAPSPGSSPTARRRASSPPPISSNFPRKVPLMPRVERLIHLELQDQRVMRQCSGCGKQHREWFEVEATMAGVRAVDETIRRWVEWGERTAASHR